MEYLTIDPNELNKKFKNKNLELHLMKSLQFMNDYIPLEFYNRFLNSLCYYKVKNIWNHIITKWNNMLIEVKSKEFINSEYSKQTYKHIHTNFDITDLDQLLVEFIDNDIFKGIFALNCIQNYYYH